jgi:hypothetical protein
MGENQEADFEEELTTILVGIAARRGESWEVVLSHGETDPGPPMQKLAAG